MAKGSSVTLRKSILRLNNEKILPWLWFVLAALVVVFDQWTKYLANTQLIYAEREWITSFFNITLRYNYGIAFSIFDDINGGQRWPLSILAALVSMALIVWIWRSGKQYTLEMLGLALVLGGAIGNLYDRVALGYVVDFIELHYAGYYWPAFNIADSAISAGAVCLLVDALFFSGKKQNK